MTEFNSSKIKQEVQDENAIYIVTQPEENSKFISELDDSTVKQEINGEEPTVEEITQQPDRYKCNICGRLYGNVYSLKFHYKKHAGENSHKCITCNKPLTNEHDISQHLLVHTDKKSFKCEQCKKCYRSKELLKKHIISTHSENDPIKCEHCGKSFPTLIKLKNHLRFVHPPTYQFECTICDRKFKAAEGYHYHMGTHIAEKPFKCDRCENSYGSAMHLKYHVRRCHPKNKPFDCTICRKSYSTQIKLQEHLETHEEERPYKCQLCGSALKFISSFKKHLREKHSSLDCEEEAEEDVKERLAEVQQVRTGARRFGCERCGRSFSNEGTLKRHLNLHGESDSYQCRHCPKSFKWQDSLIRHMRKKHSREGKVSDGEETVREIEEVVIKQEENGVDVEDEYRCGNCSEAFQSWKDLDEHNLCCKRIDV